MINKKNFNEAKFIYELVWNGDVEYLQSIVKNIEMFGLKLVCSRKKSRLYS